jgi:putative chitinase
MIKVENLTEIGVRQSDANAYIAAINDTLAKYQINTTLRISHFLSQVLHETGMLRTMRENLNYSAEGLLRIFPTRFNAATAKEYERKPINIANKVYANRYGNGDEKSGDGFKFSGKGAIQITFKSNYESISKDTGIDYVNNPKLLEKAPDCITSAGWFWNKNKCNALADKDDIIAVTKKINGGTNGLAHRTELLYKIKTALKPKPSTPPPTPSLQTSTTNGKPDNN